MVKFKCLYCITLLLFVELTVSLIPNVTNTKNINNDLRRSGKRKDKDRSTSSSGQGRSSGDSVGDKESLDLSTQESGSKDSDEEGKKPLSSLERRGWRKWHRKCRVCTEDMVKKWRDPTIKWICGGYQRARRSFKSECMMHYRNCQDGTMFVKIHNYRCPTETGKGHPQGINFFYDYKVAMSGDTSQTLSEDEPDDESSDFK